MGAVHRALDSELHREVAMKVLRGSEKVEPRFLQRFLAEGRITGKLEHPNIVPVHDLGLDSEGRVFFTMKLVKGRTLREVIHARHEEGGEDDGENSLGRLMQVVLRICDALSFAHARGVIHCDLKPENIMLGKFGEVLVMDWGLAKLCDTQANAGETTESSISLPDESSSYSLEGEVLGSPSYMAPEQARGQADCIGPQTDVFGVGAVIYDILMGGPPYAGSSMKDVLEKAAAGLVMDPRQGHGHSAGGEIPEHRRACLGPASLSRGKRGAGLARWPSGQCRQAGPSPSGMDSGPGCFGAGLAPGRTRLRSVPGPRPRDRKARGSGADGGGSGHPRRQRRGLVAQGNLGRVVSLARGEGRPLRLPALRRLLEGALGGRTRVVGSLYQECKRS